MAVSRAAHPAGKLAGGGGATAGWWLVCPIDDEPGAAAEIVAGPFPDRLEADWAALSGGLEAVAVYGARGAGQRLVLRPAPQDRAWLGALSEQLDRLAGDWDELLTDDDELTTLVVEIAAALVEAGMELHDCDGQDAAGGGAGGVCLTPEPASNGILVSWRPHDRMSVEQVRGGYLDAAVQEAMNAALAEVLAVLGFAVEPFGATGCHLVTADER
jgi:S-adenosylmethionine/arginine decarboxylase-like enzyme